MQEIPRHTWQKVIPYLTSNRKDQSGTIEFDQAVGFVFCSASFVVLVDRDAGGHEIYLHIHDSPALPFLIIQPASFADKPEVEGTSNRVIDLA